MRYACFNRVNKNKPKKWLGRGGKHGEGGGVEGVREGGARHCGKDYGGSSQPVEKRAPGIIYPAPLASALKYLARPTSQRLHMLAPGFPMPDALAARSQHSLERTSTAWVARASISEQPARGGWRVAGARPAGGRHFYVYLNESITARSVGASSSYLACLHCAVSVTRFLPRPTSVCTEKRVRSRRIGCPICSME